MYKYIEKLYLIPVLMFLFFSLIAISQSHAGVTVGSSDCCAVHEYINCDDTECSDFICGIDPFCCNISWDNICVDEAVQYCGDLCQDSGIPEEPGEPIVIVPTMGQWGMIFAGLLLGFIGIVALPRERKINRYFD